MRKVFAPFKYIGPTIDQHFSHRRVRARLVIEDTELYLYRYQEFGQSLLEPAYELALGEHVVFTSRDPRLLVTIAKALHAAGYSRAMATLSFEQRIHAVMICQAIYEGAHEPDLLAYSIYARYCIDLEYLEANKPK